MYVKRKTSERIYVILKLMMQSIPFMRYVIKSTEKSFRLKNNSYVGTVPTDTCVMMNFIFSDKKRKRELIFINS